MDTSAAEGTAPGMIEDLARYCQQSLDQHGHLAFSTDILTAMSAEDAAEIASVYGSRSLMRLPEHEVAFQEWLRKAEPAVWNDLWEGEPDAPYLISLSYLQDFAGGGGKGAFLICDLQVEDNYYFTPDMLLEKESTDFVSAVRDRFLAGGTMTVEQALTVEMSTGPMDIWHFAYLRGVDLQRAKQAVASLVADRIIVHVPKAEHLSSFFDVG